MILMDSSPLMFLAKLNRLELLLEFNQPIYMPSEVLYEATAKQAIKQGRAQNQEEKLIEDFVRSNEQKELIFVVKTIVCDAAERMRDEDPNYKASGNGEVAANSLFLNRDNYGISGPALLLYEDSDVELVFNRDDVHFLTTYALFVTMEKVGVIPSADDEWRKLNSIYRKLNKNNKDIKKSNVDASNRGDTEYESKIKPR